MAAATTTILKTRRDVLDAVKAVLAPLQSDGTVDADTFKAVAKDAVARCQVGETTGGDAERTALELVLEHQRDLPEAAASDLRRRIASLATATQPGVETGVDDGADAMPEAKLFNLTVEGLHAFVREFTEKRLTAARNAAAVAADNASASSALLGKPVTVVVAGLPQAAGEDDAADTAAKESTALLQRLVGPNVVVVAPLFAGDAEVSASATTGTGILTFANRQAAEAGVAAIQESGLGLTSMVISASASAAIQAHLEDCKTAAQTYLESAKESNGASASASATAKPAEVPRARKTKFDLSGNNAVSAPKDDMYGDLNSAADTAILPLPSAATKKHRSDYS